MHPWRLRDLKILRDFRLEREKNALKAIDNIEEAQYLWAAEASGVSPEKVYDVVREWIFRIPLRFIPYYRYSGVSEFFDNLQSRGIVTAIFSDYPAGDKMTAMGLSSSYIFCATDKNIDRLKPDPKGLFVIAETLRIPIERCLLIGDRDDIDGECARRAGAQCLILERKCSGMDNHFQTYWQLNEQLNKVS